MTVTQSSLVTLNPNFIPEEVRSLPPELETHVPKEVYAISLENSELLAFATLHLRDRSEMKRMTVNSCPISGGYRIVHSSGLDIAGESSNWELQLEIDTTTPVMPEQTKPSRVAVRFITEGEYYELEYNMPMTLRSIAFIGIEWIEDQRVSFIDVFGNSHVIEMYTEKSESNLFMIGQIIRNMGTMVYNQNVAFCSSHRTSGGFGAIDRTPDRIRKKIIEIARQASRKRKV